MKTDPHTTPAVVRSLDDLFAEARRYGLIDIFGSADGTYSANITFSTVTNTKLEARSGHGHPTPNMALQFAIDAARSIVTSVKELANV